MNEVMQTKSRQVVRPKLLLTVSSAALVVFAPAANADDGSGRPTVWIELGGAFDQISSDAVGWVPPNLTDPITNASPKPFGQAPSIGYDFDAAIGFRPNSSDWIFSASIRYGRSQLGPRHTHDQAYPLTSNGGLPSYAFLNATQQSHSTHAIMDFTAGKDVGLGLFNSGISTIHFGVRAVQLNENATANFSAFSTAPQKYSAGKIVHKADALFSRSFTGAGPTVSWDGMTPLIGSTGDGLTFDWGANAAILVGRQKTHIFLHTVDNQYAGKYPKVPIVLSHSTVTPVRDKTVIVPNVGGLVGVSYRRANARISLGYRADFFFGAIDGGLATSQKDTRGFYGPFANVSIGIGG